MAQRWKSMWRNGAAGRLRPVVGLGIGVLGVLAAGAPVAAQRAAGPRNRRRPVTPPSPTIPLRVSPGTRPAAAPPAAAAPAMSPPATAPAAAPRPPASTRPAAAPETAIPLRVPVGGRPSAGTRPGVPALPPTAAPIPAPPVVPPPPTAAPALPPAPPAPGRSDLPSDASEDALDARRDPRLAREVSVAARSAEIGQFVSALGNSAALRLRLGPELVGRRITLHTERASVQGLQIALGSLYRAGWRREGLGSEAEYHLDGNPNLRAQADRLRSQRRAYLQAALLRTETSIREQGGAYVAARLRRDLSQHDPDVPPEAVESITPAFLEQWSLLTLLRYRMGSALIENGSVWAPFRSLPTRSQSLFAAFYAAENSIPARTVSANPTDLPTAAAVTDPGAASPLPILSLPHARVEYKWLYGDRWTGPLLVARVGVPDAWATALLPGSLYPTPDDTSLYPEASQRPVVRELLIPTRLELDPQTQTWEQMLELIAREAHVNVICDSHQRPHVFRGAAAPGRLTGATLADLLDSAARYYGYVWWRAGEFLIFRHRMWNEEEKVDVPETVLQALSTDAARGDRVSAATLSQLSTLSDEQLLTLQLYGNAAGRPVAAVEPFDYNEIQLLRTALTLFIQCSPEQRELARGEGLPFQAMPPDARRVFLAVAAERQMALNPYSQDRWRFRISDALTRQRLPSGWSAPGRVTFAFDYGPHGVRNTELAVRAPVPTSGGTGTNNGTK